MKSGYRNSYDSFGLRSIKASSYLELVLPYHEVILKLIFNFIYSYFPTLIINIHRCIYSFFILHAI